MEDQSNLPSLENTSLEEVMVDVQKAVDKIDEAGGNLAEFFRYLSEEGAEADLNLLSQIQSVAQGLAAKGHAIADICIKIRIEKEGGV